MWRCAVSRLGTLALISMLVPLDHPYADERDRAMVIVVPAPVFVAPPPVVQRPPEQPWLPTPGIVSPTVAPPPGRCYAGSVICPLERASDIGRPCTCSTNSGTVEGKGLIPPSSGHASERSSGGKKS